jgi:ribosome-binding factor A
MNRRMGRVNGLLREELSQLILRELKDPRVASFVTITEVDTAPDLGTAKVYVSVMAPAEEQTDVMRGLRSAEGFLKASLRTRIQLRKIPTLTFELDATMERGADLLKLIDQVIESDSANQERSV